MYKYSKAYDEYGTKILSQRDSALLLSVEPIFDVPQTLWISEMNFKPSRVSCYSYEVLA